MDIMSIIEEDDKNLLENKRIINMSVSNQYIQRNILRHMLSPYGYLVYSTDDIDIPIINLKNNSPGFDLLIITPENINIRVQSKLRQVRGLF